MYVFKPHTIKNISLHILGPCLSLTEAATEFLRLERYGGKSFVLTRSSGGGELIGF